MQVYFESVVGVPGPVTLPRFTDSVIAAALGSIALKGSSRLMGFLCDANTVS